MSYKQVILVRKDLNLSKGKLAAQCSHASTESAFKSEDQKVRAWRKDGMKKVVLKVNDENELLKMKKLADKEKLTSALIRDAGKTQVKAGTVTCLGIGPDKEEEIDKVSGKLKIL